MMVRLTPMGEGEDVSRGMEKNWVDVGLDNRVDVVRAKNKRIVVVRW